ncbi:enamine deaminase RidA (YjgF/YER057c/UK114 family) [Porphyrobacter sp. MBR-155]|jgi:enamine deaminase RidA (YjgF/YER057c/UK114 family)|uniref:RidA family protein n=1 Tax=Porphyrobacter sp. MBR-155 TaxID=3156464 RepID=UPI000CBABFEA|nr:MAG: RidA family protein [Alphaproteobacteria bacterium HGW-Alphaproteobacteria-15]
MQIKTHNPTPWLQHFGLNHAVEVSGASRTVYFSGQTASDADGAALHPGDIVAQYKAAWACLVDALDAAGMTPANLVRMNIYTTDVDAFMATAEQTTALHIEAGAQIACTLLGVARLYDPAIMIELEATAVA